MICDPDHFQMETGTLIILRSRHREMRLKILLKNIPCAVFSQWPEFPVKHFDYPNPYSLHRPPRLWMSVAGTECNTVIELKQVERATGRALWLRTISIMYPIKSLLYGSDGCHHDTPDRVGLATFVFRKIPYYFILWLFLRK